MVGFEGQGFGLDRAEVQRRRVNGEADCVWVIKVALLMNQSALEARTGAGGFVG